MDMSQRSTWMIKMCHGESSCEPTISCQIHHELPANPDHKSESTAILKRYIIKKDATILFWSDNTKTVVRRGKKEKFDKRIAFLYAYWQKVSGMSKTQANKFLDNLEVQDE